MFFGDDDDDSFGILPSPLQSPPQQPAAPPQQLPTQLQSMQPQWSQEETRKFIHIRSELENDFTVAKRNKTLWETVSLRMRESGYIRTPDQCKFKWKNLLNRYKGTETSDPENPRLCHFYDELHAVFTARANNMQQVIHLESERASSAQASRQSKKLNPQHLSKEQSDGDEDVVEVSDEEKSKKRASRKRQAEKSLTGKPSKAANGDVYEVLKEFLNQQQNMDLQWREMMDRRANERLLFEQEWRKSMEKVERERLMVEKSWREREEQRKLREESRAERRDALLTTLLNDLIHGNSL